MLFICSKCSKQLDVQSRVYEKAYKGHDTCLDCRAKHGGYREGAGRPAIGVTKKVSITLPDEIWKVIEGKKGDMAMSGYLREFILNGLEEKGERS